MTADALWQIWQQTGYEIRAVLLLAIANLVLWFFCLWDNLKHGRGVDRLTWMIAITIPVIGPIAYFSIALPERERLRALDEDRPDDWRRSLE